MLMQQLVEMLAKLQVSQNENQARMEAKMDSNQETMPPIEKPTKKR
jgi:hypothetical protein